ncbi:hypothetical protein F4823DRAFT_78429 [Ustulina deusta]|nr:hypothetical protein F4823DRAFT_78429 [Ustulina deusta]
MATQPIEIGATEAEVYDMQPREASMESQNTESQLEEPEQVNSEVTEVQQMSIPVETEARPEEAQLVGIEGAETELAEAQGISKVEEAKSIEIDSNPGPEEAKLTNIEVAEPKPDEMDAVEPQKGPEAKNAMNKKSLPFDPAKIKKAAAATKSKGVKPAGSKPTGVTKSTSAKPARRRGRERSLESALLEARRWLVEPTSWILRNPETGCFGISSRKREGERTEITVAHGEDCGCLDVRLLHISQHVERLVKRRRLGRRSRDALVIATKIRRELPIPKDLRFPAVKKQAIRRPKREVEAEEEIVNVVEVHNQQRLVEKWKSLKAYRARPIWKDW